MNDRSSRRWLGLASLALGLAMIIVDATIVNVAIPSIIADLRLQLTDAEWVNTVYSLVFAALLVTVGRLGDLYGRKRIYLLGLALFVAASLLAASAPTGSLLIAARALQGVGAAMILPSTLSSVNAMFRGRERAIAFGIWGSVIGGMAALGPLLGGWLTTDFSWRWAFYINLPIGLVAGTVALLTVPETRDTRAARGLDPIGIGTSALGFAALVFGLIEGERYGWWRPTETFRIGSWEWPLQAVSPVPVALALAALLLPVFVLLELRRVRNGQPVLLDLRLFRYRSFRWGTSQRSSSASASSASSSCCRCISRPYSATRRFRPDRSCSQSHSAPSWVVPQQPTWRSGSAHARWSGLACCWRPLACSCWSPSLPRIPMDGGSHQPSSSTDSASVSLPRS